MGVDSHRRQRAERAIRAVGGGALIILGIAELVVRLDEPGLLLHELGRTAARDAAGLPGYGAGIIGVPSTGTYATDASVRSQRDMGYPSSGRRQHEQCFVLGRGEPGDVIAIIAKGVEDVERRCVPHQPGRIGTRAVQEGEDGNRSPSTRSRDANCSPAPGPDLDVRCGVEPDLCELVTLGVLDGQLANEVPRQVLVEQPSHAGVAGRRSRIAAKSIAARASSSVGSGKSLTICSLVMPDAR